MAEHSGFFNARLVDGVYDRRYNANDYRNNLGAIISNGVRRSGDGQDSDLKVQVVGGGMGYTVAIGRAWINGAYYFNDATWTPDMSHDGGDEIAVGTPTLARIDRIVLRYNENNNVRSVYIKKLEGTPSASPVAPDPVREGGIYDIVLADINIGIGATTLSQSNVTDQRGNGAMKETEDEEGNITLVEGDNLCGWITTPIGYPQFFQYLDEKVLEKINQYNDEWKSMKDDWASVTLFKKYEDSITLTETVTSVTVPIVQYDPTGVDILEVFVNGTYKREGVDYTRNGNVITFALEKIAGTTIAFSVYKSIDGTGLGSVLDEITELQNQLAELSNLDEYRYICTGVDDNKKLSEMCSAFFEGNPQDGKEIRINIYGDFVATTPNSGSGVINSRYKWIDVSPTGSTSRKITLDFSNCRKIILPIPNGSYNIVFNGKDMTIIGASVEASNTYNTTAIQVFGSTDGNIKAVRCRFDLEGYHRTFIGETGTYDECIGNCTVLNGEGYCFYTNANGMIRIMGGEYKAYTLATSSNSMVIKQTDTGAVVVAYGVNCPTVSKQNYRQTHAINATGGYAQVTDMITTLTVTAGTVRTTIPANKPDRG